jgi:hypothetical protein
LPPENWLLRAGEVDYSPNTVFLKRVLRELREMPANVIDNAKLTEKLIGSYSAAFEKVALTPLQTQRLSRLHKLAAQASDGITVTEEAVPDLLSLSTVKDTISRATDEAVRGALDQHRGALNELENRRANLEQEITSLGMEAVRQRDEIESSRNEQAALLASIDSSLQKKFEDVGKNASSFLADIAVIRAALSGPFRSATFEKPLEPFANRPQGQPLAATQILNTVHESFNRAGLGCALPATLLSAWAAGYVPIAFGSMARDAFSVANECLFGGNIHFASLVPTLSSPTGLLDLPAVSSFAVKTVGDLTRESSHSGDMILLVFENMNLSQLDSALLPLLRSYSGFHGTVPRPQSALAYPTPAGMWPSNVLLAGILVDSPLALPLSPELWSCSAFIDAGSKRACSKSKANESPLTETLFRLPYKAWVEWLGGFEQAGTSDTRLVAIHAAREIESGSLFKHMLHRAAAAIDQAAPSIAESKRAGFLAEMTIIPYLISRGLSPRTVLQTAPADLSKEDDFVQMLTTLFKKWGMGVVAEWT